MPDPSTPPAGLAARLWAAGRDRVEASAASPFVRGLADGSLDEGAFRVYVAQDAFFLGAFLRAYALGIARAPELDTARALHGLAGGVLDELKLHAAYAEELGIDLTSVEPLPEALAYTDFLAATAWAGPLPRLLAATTPCMRLYAHLGQRLAAERPDHDHAYSDWIRTYADPGFETLAVTLEGLLDAHAEGDDEAALAAAYDRALFLEHEFFEAPLRAVGR
jgi:thiaminase/transcriptional activator TenA